MTGMTGMMCTGDRELLARYVADGDREALGRIVQRHIGPVYAAARRQVRDPHLAEDVTQAVFILLARKAHRIDGEAALASWLFTATRYASASARRMRSRREFHERAAGEVWKMKQASNASRIDDHDSLLPLLDDAIAHLGESDRRGVLLSFFGNRTYRQVGAAMGISEEAARKRVSRAVDRLRAFFAQRGADVSGASLASVMTAQATVSAPPHLLATAANVAMITHSFAASTIVSGARRMFLWSALKPLAAAAAVLLVVSGAVVGQVGLNQAKDAPPAQLAAATQPAKSSPQSADLGDGVRVEFVAIAEGGGDWHTPAGAAAPAETVKEMLAQLAGTQIILPQPATHRALVRVTGPADANVNVRVPKSLGCGAVNGDAKREGEQVFLVQFTAPADAESADIEVTAATGEWQSVVVNDNLDSQFQGTHGSSFGGIVFTALGEENGKPSILVVTELHDRPWRVAAEDDAGTILDMHPGGQTSAGKISTCQPVFNVDRDHIRRIEVQSRPYNKFAACRNCTLDPKHPSQPTIETKKQGS
jgi:RNA polymerase sigma factor (sigma-70 family)